MRLSFRDQAHPMHVSDRRYDSGNRAFVASLPPGKYEAEDHNDAMHIFRVGDDGARELVMMLPPGDYSVESDGDGAHLYREPDGGEPVVQPLGDRRARDADMSERERSSITLRAWNYLNCAHYAGERRPPTPHANPEHRALQEINAANRRRFGGDDAA